MISTKLLRSTMVVTTATVLLVSAGAALANSCNVPSGSHPTIQSAVNDLACSTINVAAGTYNEQVTIPRSLTLMGVDGKTVIKAPPVLTPDLDGFRNIVEINNGATVRASHITVTGPVIGACDSIATGIAIIGGALLDIDHSAVNDVRNEPPLSGCVNGHGILAGTQVGGPADIGHLIADHVLVTGYQQCGIVVEGSGSTGQIDHNTVQSAPTDRIAQNGIEILFGAMAAVEHNTVSGNECNDVAGGCGPDFFNQIQAIGIFVFDANSGTTVSNNDVHANDIGIYANSGGDIDHNDVSANDDFGLVIDDGYTSTVHHNNADGATGPCSGTSCDGILALASGATFHHNSADKNAINGIEVLLGTGNTFQKNDMKGNVFDAKDTTLGSGTVGTDNTWIKNKCKTSSPSGLCK